MGKKSFANHPCDSDQARTGATVCMNYRYCPKLSSGGKSIRSEECWSGQCTDGICVFQTYVNDCSTGNRTLGIVLAILLHDAYILHSKVEKSNFQKQRPF